MRRSIGWLVVVAVVAIAAAPAAAQPADGLAWSAEDRCGSVAALRARIAVHLGRPLEDRDAIRAEVEVVRAPIEGDVRATVQIETRRGRAAREVHGANCAAVVDAVAFVLASAVTDDGEVPVRPVSPTVADDAVVPWFVRPVPVPEVRPSPLGVQLGLDGWSDAGTLPQLRMGVGGSIAIDKGRARAELSAATWRDGWAPLSDVNSGATGVTLRSVTVRGCYGVWRLWLCGGILQGTMRGVSGPGAVPAYPWTALSFQTLWSRPIAGPIRIAGSVEGLANLARPEFALDGGRIHHRPAPFALRLGLGLAVAIW